MIALNLSNTISYPSIIMALCAYPRIRRGLDSLPWSTAERAGRGHHHGLLRRSAKAATRRVSRARKVGELVPGHHAPGNDRINTDRRSAVADAR